MKLPHSRTIGTFYFVFAILAGLVGVLLSLVIRLNLSNPDSVERILTSFWLPFVSSGHALIMTVFMMMPALFGGFANWLVPMMIGCHDMQFKWLNLLAFLLLPLGVLVLIGAIFLPFTLVGMRLFLIIALHIIAFSFLLSAINFIATILAARAPFMRLGNMPPFIWSVLVASFLIVACVPVMSAALSLKLGESDLQPDSSTLPVIMWFLTHPELFILLLPAFGIISQIVATFCTGRLVMENVVNCAFVLMGVLGFILWSETVFSHGHKSHVGDAYQSYFFISLMVMALPLTCIILSWLLTLMRAVRHWQVPMLWAMGFISMILVATLSAISLHFSKPFEIGAFIGHFHYIMGLSGVFAIFAGWYFWFGKISGYQIRELSGRLHFWTMFIGVHLTFVPQHFSAQTYAPHSWGRIIDDTFGWQNLASLGACFSAFSLFLFFYTCAEAFIRKRPAAANPWGAGAYGLEWQLSSPPYPQEKIRPLLQKISS